jgi:hypothetical protein
MFTSKRQKTRRRLSLIIISASFALNGCAPVLPPLSTADANADTLSDQSHARIVFIWPPGHCSPPGYYTLVTADGTFLGNISEGTQLVTEIPSGFYTIFGWEPLNPNVTTISVPVMTAHLSSGKTYFALLAFGEWDETGPAHLPSSLGEKCFVKQWSESAALLAIKAASTTSLDYLPVWRRQLARIIPSPAGQAWLKTQAPSFTAVSALAAARLAAFTPIARSQATLGADDAPIVP